MNAKFWSLATVLALGTACLDDDEDEAEPTSEPTSEPSEPSEETEPEPATYAYITQNFSGSAAVVPDESYEGSETLAIGINDLAGTGNYQTELIWTIVGAPAESPVDCADCLFAFDLNLTFNAAASTDPNAGGADDTFSYAVGTSDYGENTLFYKGDDDEWSPWLVDGQVAQGGPDLEDVEHLQEVSFDGTNFTYTDGTVDFYYYY